MQTLRVKNMVCPRCIKVVKEEIERLGYDILHVQLGEVRLSQEVYNREEIAETLEKNGFELLEDKNAQYIEKIKNLIIDLVQNDKLEHFHQNLSSFLVDQIQKDYSFLSNLFSSTESITIEKYLILVKIERVKEFLIYDELTLSEIAYRLAYSSSAYLSRQFKQVTGHTPTQFKELSIQERNSLDALRKSTIA